MVLKMDGWVQPATADQGVARIKSRSNTATAPTPTQVVLGALAQEKTASLGGGSGLRQVGVAREVFATHSAAKMAKQLQWRPTAMGGQIAALSFSAEGAHGLRLGVVVKQLSGSAQVRVYSQAQPATVFQISGQEILQVIERNTASGDTSLDAQTWWTPDLGSDEVTLEIELPPGTPVGTLDIAVPRVSHIFENLSIPTEEEFSAKINESDSCNLDATCYDTYASQRNAVARMVFTSGGGSFVCTGTLLNDTQSSGTPYFLTANHCISTQAAASSLQTDWFYRSPTCNSRTLSSATTRRVGGAALLYATDSTDTTLLRLNDAPPSGATFAGWDASTQTAGTSVVGLHHPRGDLLKASFGSLNGQASCMSTGGSGFQCSGSTGNYYRVTWSQGTTEGGSSGSALFKGGTHVVGTLYGGSATCTNTTSPDFYGRFDLAYNAALKNWLAPAAAVTGRTAIYRFFNSKTGAHFFTSSASERDFVIRTYPEFSYENIAFYAYAQPTAGQSTVFRFFNQNNGAHFYTINQAESDYVRATYPVYKYEGPIWYAQTASGNSATAIYRFYKPNTGTHFFTINAAERDYVIATYKDFQYEGVAYYAWTGN
ncbi:trypsin-like peptidase domain-containing protein [Paracidovorax sp. MALMAid1276]|uniref:trypsin-like peptidase domain-containing protein n=1 Tax=Paracidovorax sp. MALMAid1276 TaxID=3411631 RepID=UPI003B9A086F